MKENDFTHLSNEELISQRKKIKSNTILIAGFIGLMVGVVVFAVVKSGFTFFSLLPLVFVYIAVQNSKKNKAAEKALDEEFKNRKLA